MNINKMCAKIDIQQLLNTQRFNTSD